jgi:Predicted permeases
MFFNKLTPKTQGILLIISSAFCFALMSAMVRLSGDLPTLQKCFFRNLVSIPFAVAILYQEHPNLRQDLKHTPGLLLRAVCGTLGLVCNFYAIDHMLLADASILNRLSPFVTVLLSWLFLKERINRVQLGSILVAFIGALCIIRPGMGSLSSFPALIATLGGIGVGSAMTAVRWLTKKGVNKALIVFIFSVFSSLLMLPFIVFNYQPMTWQQLFILLLAGLAATGGQFSITYAYAKAPAREISVFDYTIVIFSALLGFCLFSQIPDFFSWLGYAIIIGVSIAMFFYDMRE